MNIAIPDLYRKLSMPVSEAVAKENAKRFAAGVKKLREECCIPHVACIFSIVVDDGDGKERKHGGEILLGPQAVSATLAAMLYGRVQQGLMNELARVSELARVTELARRGSLTGAEEGG